MCAFARIVSIARFRASFSFSWVAASSRKNETKSSSHIKIKTKKILTSQTQTSFLLKAQQRIQQPTTSGRRRQLLGMAHRGRERAKGPGVEREFDALDVVVTGSLAHPALGLAPSRASVSHGAPATSFGFGD